LLQALPSFYAPMKPITEMLPRGLSKGKNQNPLRRLY